MRVIEERIIKTIQTGEEGIYNLSCRDKLKIKSNGSYKLYLWDNLIFSFDVDEKIKTKSFSLCGYNTDTTKSRINTVLNTFNFKVYQKNYQLYLFDEINEKELKIDECNLYTIDIYRNVNVNEK